MKRYSEEEIDQLIGCPKLIADPPKKDFKIDRGSRRNDMRLKAQDGDLEFSIFIRVNQDFEENFSVGLVYHPKDEPGQFCLLRCNGPHGDFVGSPTSPHFLYHIHKAKPENIEAGARAERGGEETDRYASYQQAIRYLLNVANALNAEEYFPAMQLPLEFERGGPGS